MNFIQSNEVFKSDFDIIDSLDSEASRRLFIKLPEMKPTLEMALREANIKDHDIILHDSRRFANAARKNPEITKLGLSDDEANAISCYTFEGIGGAKPPYQVINEGLAVSRNRAGLESTRKLLFLLLSGLRKLPRTRPSAGQTFYRGIRVKVPQTRKEATKTDCNGTIVTHQYYEKGRTVTWWGFTSTFPSMEDAYEFIQGVAASTVFHIGGEDLWGYSIKDFSQYPKEDEILLEPEAKVLVKGSSNIGTSLTIEVTFQPFNRLALEDIIPVGNVSSVPTQIGQPSAIEAYSGGGFLEIQIKPKQKSIVSQDYSIHKGMNFIRSNEVFKGDFDILDSLDSEASRRLFIKLPEIKPTLWEALEAAKVQNIKAFYDESTEFGSIARDNPEIAKLGLSDDEVCAISCYTLQGIGGAKPPYEVINEGLVGSRNREGLGSTRKLLFLLLSGLRKLPRTRPSAGQIFYRGIDVKVPRKREEATKIDKNGNVVTHQYYEKGRIVTWWGFTSTSTSLKAANDFLQGAATSTLFHIGGEDLWGYDIKAFSKFVSEEEILLEPEAKVLVKDLVGNGTSLTIEVTLQPFNRLALEDIIPVGSVSPVLTQIGQTSNMQKKWSCAWKECPPYVNQMVRYSVDPYNPRVAAKMVAGDNCYCTIIGNTFVPLNTVTSWRVKILNSKNNDREYIFIGVAPSDINQNGYDYNTMYGWYLHCKDSTLWSGPPHNYRGNAYPQQQMMSFGGFTNVGVVMDTIKGELSFVLNGVNLGVAYERIPLNKPLVPCVLLWKSGDSVELDIPEAVNEDNTNPIPPNTIPKSVEPDPIILTQDKVSDISHERDDALPNETPEEADESAPETSPFSPFLSERFYFSSSAEDDSIDCIDKAGSMLADFKKKPPTLREALMSMYYGEKTEGLLEMFTERAKEKLDEFEAPGLTVEDVAAIFCYTYEWDKERFGKGIDGPYEMLNKSISVERSNSALRKTRAFLFLLLRTLRKLPRYTPANRTLYRGIGAHAQTEVDPEHPDRKPYAKGNEKTWWTFTSTTEDLEITRIFVQRNKGTLFTLSGEAWGYDISIFSNFPDEKEILLEPERKLSIKGVKKEDAIIAVNAEILDTPLALKDIIKVKPVKIKEKKSKIKEAPRNLRVEEITESTVTLLWDAPKISDGKMLSYQVSAKQTSDRFVNRNPENIYIVRRGGTRYTVRDLEEGKKYEFRVKCKYRDGWGKEWSEKIVVKIRERYKGIWKECPGDVYKDKKYSVNKERDPRVATKVNSGDYCTIIGSTSIPLNTVTSWNIKILKSEYNNGNNIYIGIAPSDINQNKWRNCDECGWYFDCFCSTLRSGPPHNFRCKEYGSRKGDGQYVHTGDSVGVVVDTTNGDLSFVLDGVNLGAAYKGIPLDKPLVPCILLYWQGDSVGLII